MGWLKKNILNVFIKIESHEVMDVGILLEDRIQFVQCKTNYLYGMFP